MNLNKFLKMFIPLVCLSLVAFSTGCSKNSKNYEPISRTQVLLDTPCTITIYDKASEKVLDQAFDVLKDIHNKMNAHEDSSEISAINKNSGLNNIKVSDNTFYVVKEAKKYSELTQGKFDITIGPLINLWGINTENARVPSEEEIKAKLPLINYRDIILDENEKSIKLKNKGMSIDLGGIAKGFAADEVAKVLKKNGVKHAVIDLGGNILTVGTKIQGTDWKIGIQDPTMPRGDYFGIVKVSDKAVVTSGIYERFLEVNGQYYHHIFDTSTGYPVDNSLASVTIITKTSINGDALAKAFCFGIDKGLAFIEGIKDVDAIFVTKNKEVYITKGLKGNLEITDSNFKILN